MISRTLTYRIDPYQVDASETYKKVWTHLANRMGAAHHGYFLPPQGASDVAGATFSVPSLAAHETYRTEIAEDADCKMAFDLTTRTGCVLPYERTFTRPVLTGASPAGLGLT